MSRTNPEVRFELESGTLAYVHSRGFLIYVAEFLADKLSQALKTVSPFLTRGELSRKRAENLWDECKIQRTLRWVDGGEQQWDTLLGKLGEDK